MSEPVVLMNKDQLSLQFGVQKCLQVGVKRDARVDGLALHYKSPTDSGVFRRRFRIRSRRRRRRPLAYPFNQVRRRRKAAILGKTRKWTSATASDQDGSEQAMKNISTQDGSEQAAILVTGSRQPLANICKQVGGEEAAILGTESRQLSAFEQDGCAHALSLNRISEQTLSSGTDRDGSELTTSSSNLPTASGVAGRRDFRSRKRKRRTLVKPINQNCIEKDAILRLRNRWTSAIAFDQDGSVRAAMLGAGSSPPSINISKQDDKNQATILCTGSKQQSTNNSEQDECDQSAILGPASKTPSTNISEEDGGEEAAILETESKQPSTINTFEQNECMHALPLNPISGQTSNRGSKLTSSNKPSCVNGTRQDKSISKEDFMALLRLSPTDVVARVRTCNRHTISKDLHIKSRNIWRKICGEGNICYSPLVAKAVLRSFKAKVSLKRSNSIDHLAFQPVPLSINIKNLKGPRPRVPKAANRRKSLIDLCSQRPTSLNVLLKRDSVLDQLALQISTVTCTSCSSNSPGKSTVNPSIAKRTSKAPLSTETSGLASNKLGFKWLSVNIKRDSGLDMLARQTSDTLCESLPSSYPGMSNIIPTKAKNTSKAPMLTDTTSSLAPEKSGCKWLSVNIKRDSGLDMLVRQTSDSICESLPSSYPRVGNAIPTEAKNTSKAPLLTDTASSLAPGKSSCKWLSVNIKRDSGLDMLAQQTSDTTCKFLSSNSSGTGIVSPSKAKRTSAVTLPTDSTISDSGSGLSVLSRKTTNRLFKSRSSNSPGVSIMNSSYANLASKVSLPTSATHVMRKPDLKNLCIKIDRDSCIDQLSLQTSNTTVTNSSFNRDDSSVSHQPTLKLPLDSSISPLTNVPREGMKNSVNRNHKGKLRLLPNLEVSKASNILGPRTGVIKLRRLMSDDWSIIQPDEPGSESSGSKSDAAESTDSENATAELTRNPCVSRNSRLPTSSSSGSEGGVSHKTRSRDSHCANQQNLSAVPSEQIKAGPVFRSSAGRTVSSVSCSNSPKRRTRSVLHVEESHLDYNENENPQKHDVPLVKTVTMIEELPTGRVGKYGVLRESSEKILGNDPLEEPHTKIRDDRLKDHLNNYNLVKPSISSYMSAKKPLGVKSPNHEPTC